MHLSSLSKRYAKLCEAKKKRVSYARNEFNIKCDNNHKIQGWQGMIAYNKLFFAVLLSLAISGCSAMRSYDKEMKGTVSLISSGQVDSALAMLDKNNSGEDKDLLYFLEKGELLKMKGQLQNSVEAWFQADRKLLAWEEEAKITAGKVAGHVGSVFINDKTRRYDGHDYEKVMLSTRMALDHLALGDWDTARADIKKTHEREAIIADLRAKEAEEVESKAKEKHISTTFKDLKGYPVEALDAPAVVALKNGYQSAFSHYLAGFVYEALNEPALAAPGYRQAIELRPDLPMLEESLLSLDTRQQKLKPDETDVLFVLESGAAPALESVTIPIPVLIGGAGIVPISFPTIHSDSTLFTPGDLTVDAASVPLAEITNIDVMARRALRDDMPGIIVRGALRAAIKAAEQVALSHAGDYGRIASILVNVVNVATESADERSWRALPASISIGRATLKSGVHQIALNTGVGQQTFSVDIQGAHAVVPVRILGGSLYVTQPQYGEKIPKHRIQPVIETGKNGDKKGGKQKKKSGPVAQDGGKELRHG